MTSVLTFAAAPEASKSPTFLEAAVPSPRAVLASGIEIELVVLFSVLPKTETLCIAELALDTAAVKVSVEFIVTALFDVVTPIKVSSFFLDTEWIWSALLIISDI